MCRKRLIWSPGISIALSFVLLIGWAPLDRVWADSHYLESLNLISFDEKTQAPGFTLEDLNGNEVRLEDHRGKIVLINFWATWCPPCIIEMPSMEKLHKHFKDRDFIILAVDLRESRERVKVFRDKLKLTFPMLLDAEGTVGLGYGIMALPTTYLVDREGYLIAAAVGPRDWASKEALELIDHLLDSTSGS